MGEQILKDQIRQYLQKGTVKGRILPMERFHLVVEADSYNIDEKTLDKLIDEVRQESGFAPVKKKVYSQFAKLNETAERFAGFARSANDALEVIAASFDNRLKSDTVLKRVDTAQRAIMRFLFKRRNAAWISAIAVLGVVMIVSFTWKPDSTGEAASSSAFGYDLIDPVSANTSTPATTTALRNGEETSAVTEHVVTNKNSASLETQLLKLTDEKLSFLQREQIANELLKDVFAEKSKVIILHKNTKLGTELAEDYMDILLPRRYQVEVKNQKINKEGKITELSLVEKH